MKKMYFVIIELVDKDISFWFDTLEPAQKWYYQAIANYFNACVSLRHYTDDGEKLLNLTFSNRWDINREQYTELRIKSLLSQTRKEEHIDGHTGESMD